MPEKTIVRIVINILLSVDKSVDKSVLQMSLKVLFECIASIIVTIKMCYLCVLQPLLVIMHALYYYLRYRVLPGKTS